MVGNAENQNRPCRAVSSISHPWDFGFVSDFGFRASDFFLTAVRD
jgi:hypothetical protein